MDTSMSNITLGTVNSVEGNSTIEDPNGVTPDGSFVRKKNKKFKKSGSYMYGESENTSKGITMSIAKSILNEYKFDTPEDAWKHQAKYDFKANKYDTETLRMNEVPYDIMELLLNADPASANSFIYHISNINPDNMSKLLCKIDDTTSVYLRSGSAVVFKGKEAYSYNQEALLNLRLSQPLKS